MQQESQKHSAKEARLKRVCTVWFHTYEILENANVFVKTESRSVIMFAMCTSDKLSLHGTGEEKKKGQAAQQYKQILRGEGNALCFDCSEGFVGLYSCRNSPNCILYMAIH